MILILEGPDGSGKSTLAEKLRERLQKEKMTHVLRHGPYKDVLPEDLARIYFRSMSSALTFDDHVILDRCWLSEPIYGEVYRNGANRIDIPRKRMLERAALAREAIVIHCQPEFETCKNAFLARQDEEYLDNTEQLKQVYQQYDSLPMSTSLPVMHYDYEFDDFEALMLKIYKHYKTHENIASGGGNFLLGNILMLCDKGPRTNVKESAVVVPFINFLDNDGPSRMLATTLENEGVSEHSLYWINTQTYQGTPTTPSFIKDLRPSKIFAVGNNAYAWALSNEVKAIKLPPPLYHMQNYPDQPYTILDTDYGNFNQ